MKDFTRKLKGFLAPNEPESPPQSKALFEITRFGWLLAALLVGSLLFVVFSDSAEQTNVETISSTQQTTGPRVDP